MLSPPGVYPDERFGLGVAFLLGPRWKVLADLDNWARWDTSMERVELHCPLKVGSTVTMTPKGQDPITSVITEVAENERYADQAEFGGVMPGFSHTLTRLPGGGSGRSPRRSPRIATSALWCGPCRRERGTADR